MKRLLLLALVAFAAAAASRIRRQSDPESRFWWLKLEVENTGTGNIGDATSGGSNVGSVVREGRGNKPALSDFNNNPGNDFSSGSGGTPAVQPKAGSCGGSESTCVPYFQCDEGRIVTDGAGLIDIRVGDTVVQQHSDCPRYLDVCCKIPDASLTHTPAPPTIPHTPGCGHRNTEGIHASIRGLNTTQTQFGEFPWMVAILRVENIGGENVNLYLCGGSLLQPNVVLTAAHCINNYGSEVLKIRAGEWDTQSDYELYPHQDRRVSQVIVHPAYNGGSLWNDLAIIILDTALPLSPNIDTICLPKPNESFEHVTCIATGWGKDKFGKEGRFQNILKQVSLEVVPHDTCENALRTTRLGQYFKLDSSFLCAGGKKGIDTCKGDGGSPLVCTRPGTTESGATYFQVGIVAWGIGCGENGIPGVYARVTQAVNWIYESMTPYLFV